MKIINYLIIGYFLSLSFVVLAQKQPKRVNPMTPIEEIKGLPHVLIVGDSISIGYTLPTRELLKGKVNLHRIPTNGGPTIQG